MGVKDLVEGRPITRLPVSQRPELDGPALTALVSDAAALSPLFSSLRFLLRLHFSFVIGSILKFQSRSKGGARMDSRDRRKTEDTTLEVMAHGTGNARSEWRYWTVLWESRGRVQGGVLFFANLGARAGESFASEHRVLVSNDGRRPVRSGDGSGASLNNRLVIYCPYRIATWCGCRPCDEAPMNE
ncbi:hypothetical protein L209DRAFT_25075 [Thermothelomyces heterothallicus CBS 203.75]